MIEAQLIPVVLLVALGVLLELGYWFTAEDSDCESGE